MRQGSIHVAFVLSGVAGLAYEVIWSRYLGLYVGHSAYAQVLVLTVSLGGMAVGSLATAGRSKTLAEPLRWYAAAEGLLALFGLAFHTLFIFATDFSYGVLFPALGSAGAVGAGRWAIAGLLIFPQAVILGTTFPLMAAGLVRGSENRPGDGVAQAYLLNTLGGAAMRVLAHRVARPPWYIRRSSVLKRGGSRPGHVLDRLEGIQHRGRAAPRLRDHFGLERPLRRHAAFGLIHSSVVW